MHFLHWNGNGALLCQEIVCYTLGMGLCTIKILSVIFQEWGSYNLGMRLCTVKRLFVVTLELGPAGSRDCLL